MGYWLSQASQGALQREAMEMMGYDAMTVGSQDLGLGVDQLRSLADEASFSILSANLVERETGLPAFTPYVVIERGGVRLGVLGLTEDSALDSAPDGQAYEMLPYQITVSAYLDDLAAQSDLIVLLSHVGLYDDKLLAEQFGAIDAIIGGRNARRMVAPEIIDGTPIVQLGARGEDLGVLQMALDDKNPVVHRWRVLGLGPEFHDHADMLDLVGRYRDSLQPPTVVPTQEPRY